MELKQYFGIIYKRLWIVVLLTLIAAITSAYVSFYLLDPVYQANTTLYVNNKRIDPLTPIAYNDLLVGQQLVKDYREIVKSRTITSTVIKELNMEGITPEKLASQISVNSKNETRIIEITVEDGSAVKAKQIANKVGEVFINKANELMKVENISIVDEAQTPEGPIRPKPYMNIALSVFIGLITSVGICFLIEYFDDTIKSTEDVEKYLGLTVLGTIPVLNIK